MFTDSKRTKSVIRTKSDYCSPFRFIKHSALLCLYRFLAKMFFSTLGLGLHFGSVYSSSVSQKNGIFCDQGLTEMLEASDVEKTRQCVPFLGAIISAYCGVQNADVTLTYTSIVKIVGYLYWRCGLTRWGKVELTELKTRIRKIKSETKITFCNTRFLLSTHKNGIH